MTTLAEPMSVEDDGEIFSAASYDLPIPAVDGYRAQKITIRFIGVVDLDRTRLEHLSFVESLRLAIPVRLICIGSVSGKGFSHRVTAGDEDEVAYYASVRIADVELGEPA